MRYETTFGFVWTLFCLALIGGCSERSHNSMWLQQADAGPFADGALEASLPGDGDIAPPCVAGTYSGTFEGTVTQSLVGTQTLSGDVNLTLEQSLAKGQEFVYEIRDGSLTGLAAGLFPFSGRVIGTLNCAAGRLEGGRIENASVTVDMDYLFEGTLDANYVHGEYRFIDGTWEGMQIGGDGTGSGTWQADFVP